MVKRSVMSCMLDFSKLNSECLSHIRASKRLKRRSTLRLWESLSLPRDSKRSLMTSPRTVKKWRMDLKSPRRDKSKFFNFKLRLSLSTTNYKVSKKLKRMDLFLLISQPTLLKLNCLKQLLVDTFPSTSVRRSPEKKNFKMHFSSFNHQQKNNHLRFWLKVVLMLSSGSMFPETNAWEEPLEEKSINSTKMKASIIFKITHQAPNTHPSLRIWSQSITKMTACPVSSTDGLPSIKLPMV